MNWSKIKTILIILFLCTDIFLLSIILFSTKNSVTPEIVTSTVSILAEHGIKIDENIIPRKTPPVSYVEADNVIYDHQSFAKALCGEDAVSSETKTRYSGSAGKISYNGDRFDFTPSGPSAKLEYKDAKSALSAANSYLTNLGIELSHAKSAITETDDGYIIEYNNYIASLPIFNCNITLTLQNGDVSSVSGSWFNNSEQNGQESEMKTVTGILIDFLRYTKNLPSSEITDLELGYCIFEDETYHKSATLVPSWHISLNGEKDYYLDARNAQ